MLERETGSLEVGKRADLIVLRTDTPAFTPMNDVRKHLVYAENGSSLELVMVNGIVVVRDGKLTQIDETEILREVREVMPAYLAAHREIAVMASPAFTPCHGAADGVGLFPVK